MSTTVYKKTALTGGTAADLDGINGTGLVDSDMAFVTVAGVLYTYILDDDLGGAESSPNIIAPDTNPGNKRWVLQGSYVPSINGNKPPQTYTHTVTAAEIASGTALITITMVTLAKIRGLMVSYMSSGVPWGSNSSLFGRYYLYNTVLFAVELGASALENDVISVTVIEAL